MLRQSSKILHIAEASAQIPTVTYTTVSEGIKGVAWCVTPLIDSCTA